MADEAGPVASAGSSRGYHFITEFRSCPRKWFLRYVAGLEPVARSAAASMGSVLHKLQEDFYLGSYRDELPPPATIEAEFEPYRAAWFEAEDYEMAMLKIATAFNVWRTTFGFKDLEDYDIEWIEQEFNGILPNGVEVTGRMDRIMKRKEYPAIVLFDTKTTSWSPESAHKKVVLADQVTMYTWLLQQKYGDIPIEMQPDICYLKPRIPTCHRYSAIYRSRADVESFIWGLTHDWDRLISSLRSYENNEAPAEYLFPRHSTVCAEFGCPYEDICRARLDETTPPPITGYVKRAPLRLDDVAGGPCALDNYVPIIAPDIVPDDEHGGGGPIESAR